MQIYEIAQFNMSNQPFKRQALKKIYSEKPASEDSTRFFQSPLRQI